MEMGRLMLIGADVSSWQNDLGPNTLDFVVVKATQGAWIRDPHFLMHVQTAHARGQLVFAYHFGEQDEGAAGANNFLAAIAPVIDILSGVAYDCEYQIDTPTARYGPRYSDAQAWNTAVEAAHPNLSRFVYTAAYYWVSVLGNPPPLTGTRLWWAHMVPDYNNPDPQALAAQATTFQPDLPWAVAAIRQVGWAGTVGGQHPVDIDVTPLTRVELAGANPTEDDLTPEQDNILRTCAKAILQLGGALTRIEAELKAEGSILEYGDADRDGKPDHIGAVQLQAQLDRIEAALTPKATS